MTERILAAAIRLKRDNCTYSLLPPARHGEVIRLVGSIYKDLNIIRPSEQGFVTSHHRFVDRTEGKIIARNANQLIERASPLDDLFSEDMW